MSDGIGITQLEKSCETFANKLRKDGFNVEVEVFRTGKGGTELYGPSYVEMILSREDNDDFYCGFKFLTSGYAASGHDEIGDLKMKWSTMKAEAIFKIEYATKISEIK